MQLAPKSFVDIGSLDENMKKSFQGDEFWKLFYSKPKERAKICIHNGELEVHRWQKSYGTVPDHNEEKKGFYMFRGKHETIEPIPQVFHPFLKVANTKGVEYNQLTVCWYESEDDYIAMHSDFNDGLDPEAGVLMINLCKPDTKPRLFDIKARGNTTDALIQKMSIPLRHGTMIRMYGERMQTHFRHGVMAVDEDSGPRISLSFRKYG
jgi:hypothetical protein